MHRVMHNYMIPLSYNTFETATFSLSFFFGLFISTAAMGASVSVKDMRGIPDIVERKDFYEMTGFNE